VLRFDTFDPDVSHARLSATTVPERDFIAGFNWYISDAHLKLQANYIRKTYTKDVLPALNLMFVGFQTSW
jgi:phosphate-selective porin